jgi:carbon storage regulator
MPPANQAGFTEDSLQMLVLSRKQSQRIRLGDSIVITVVRVNGERVQLGIQAPSNVLVLRDELEDRSQQAYVQKGVAIERTA